RWAVAGAPEQVREHDQLGEAEGEGPDRDEEVDRPPSGAGVVGEDPPGHVIEELHGEVEQVESDDVEGEVDLSEPLVVHPPCDLGEPVVEAAEEAGQAAADDRVMEVADDPE